MGSVRHRIIGAIILCSLLAALTAGGFSLVYIQNRIRQDTFDYLTESAKVYGNQMNTVTASLEATVDALSRSIVGIIDVSRIDDPAYFYELSEETEKIAAQFDRNDIDAMSVYVRFDPRRSYSTAGFFHADANGDGVLERQVPTDLAQYAPSDREHVGWFYEPLEAGKPIWMNPYYNANINVEMLSYIAPIFVNGEAIGVVGVDVNFDRLKSIVAKGPKVGKAILLNDDYQFLVHDLFKLTDSLGRIDNGSLRPLQADMESRPDGTAVYKLFGEKKILGFSRMQNGWTVAVAMTEDEAFSSLNRTVMILVVLNILIVLLMVIIAYFVGRYLNRVVLRNSELEEQVQERTRQLIETNEYLEDSMAELESKQAEMVLVNQQLEDSLTQLRETQEQLIISEKLASLGELVAGVAHEINTPLGIGVTLNSFVYQRLKEMKGRFDAGTLSKADLDECFQATLEALELSVRNLQRAADIVETFKQVAADQSALDIRRIKLCEYIRKILMNLSPKLKDTRHQVVLDCDDTIELITYPGVLAQILTNLIINSLDHGFSGISDGAIEIRAYRRHKMIELIYTDNGVGIPPENIERVFNPFFTTRRNKGSSGLGLHIIHNLVTQTLQGNILLKSHPGQGVEFRICFPEMDVSEDN